MNDQMTTVTLRRGLINYKITLRQVKHRCGKELQVPKTEIATCSII